MQTAKADVDCAPALILVGDVAASRFLMAIARELGLRSRITVRLAKIFPSENFF